jgi:myosin heavy subunit
MEDDLQSPVDPIEFFNENDRVLALMNMRRRVQNPQQTADEIKATLCNKIQELVRSTPGLRDRIIAISDIDPELTAYIIALESINNGIWCPTCKVVKKFGDAPASSVASQPAVRVVDDASSLEISKLQAHLRSAKEELSLLKDQNKAINNQIELMEIKFGSYVARLNAVTAKESRVQSVQSQTAQTQQHSQSVQQSVHTQQSVHSQSVQQSQVPSHPMPKKLQAVQSQSTLQKLRPVQAQSQVQPQSQLSGLTKEELRTILPPAPEFDIRFTPTESTSAEFLLE